MKKAIGTLLGIVSGLAGLVGLFYLVVLITAWL